MGSENLDAIETARRVLFALGAKQDPNPADVDKLRRLAPPLSRLPLHELADKVMQIAQIISAVKIDADDRFASDLPVRRRGGCSVKRVPRPKRADQLSRSIAKRRK